ncbi:capsule biosynthesis phosphatase [Paenibacillus cellulosilyticus]|uniref:Capsule biosynthesis phosphatase n=1 Tax=Paenibacillus cellulosilyticus TaxID=375489 RepID=A0A2V2YWP6_9BACL|nr:HAD hydrolase family protein [Paenibacillus cellulosilyticus]PWW03219.1 capsule biosynthesis phosphatase [Paenibacillus cellulosilyticus]QKS43708.1 HAD hydrolase family protein [Paenibacillus cellulosilyticus]
MRIVVDLDGTICELRQENQSYADVVPLEGAIEALHQLRMEGHSIIIHTARNMRTCGGNVGKVGANVGMVTYQWLERHAVPYDEIVFGKPYGDIYIDDLGYRYLNWDDTLDAIRERRE